MSNFLETDTRVSAADGTILERTKDDVPELKWHVVNLPSF